MTTTPATDAATERYLQATPLLDIDHPSIRRLVDDRGWEQLPEFERIGAVYRFVRDEIAFGYNAGDDLPASAVLADGCGQCNTKATLLMALLRGAGVPCRFHGAAIDKELQHGVVTGLLYRVAPQEILHSWVEVRYDGRWVRLEGVIIDSRYLDGLRDRFPDRRADFLGFGVGTMSMANPPIDWRGDDTEIQMTGLSAGYGVFDDPDGFYTRVGTNLRGLRKALFRLVVRKRMNAMVCSIRRFC